MQSQAAMLGLILAGLEDCDLALYWGFSLSHPGPARRSLGASSPYQMLDVSTVVEGLEQWNVDSNTG